MKMKHLHEFSSSFKVVSQIKNTLLFYISKWKYCWSDTDPEWTEFSLTLKQEALLEIHHTHQSLHSAYLIQTDELHIYIRLYSTKLSKKE